MRRREFVALLGGAATSWPAVTPAQPRGRLGYLSGGMKGDNNEQNTAGILKESLRALGWRLGETLEIEERWANGDFASLPHLAKELVARRPDVLVSTGTTETRSLQALTSTIPIIFMQVSVDPVAAGFVKHIARPGGNIPGFMQAPHFLWGKRIELLTELLGRAPRRLAWIGNPRNTGSEANWADARDAAVKGGSELIRVDVSSASDLDRAFDGLKGRDALLVMFDFLLAVEKQRGRRARGPATSARRLRESNPGPGRRIDVLRGGPERELSPGGAVRASSPERDRPRRSSGSPGEPVRARAERQDGQGPRPCRPRLAPRASRRGDRVRVADA